MSQPASGTPGDGAAGSGAVAPPSLLNIANALTVLRLVMVPLFVVFLVAGGAAWRTTAFATFALASVTDLLDGELARRRNLITDFGKIADPIADKALTGSALVTLSALGELSWWVTLVILARELLVTALRFWVIRRGVIAASRGGKIKTMLQVIAISLYILPLHVTLARQVLMGAAVVVTVVTGADYVVRAVRLHRAVPGLPPSGDPGPAPAPPPASARPDEQPEQAGPTGQSPGRERAPGDFARRERASRERLDEPPAAAAAPAEPAGRSRQEAGAGEENAHDG